MATTSIDPLMVSLDLPDLAREQTLSPTEAIYAPFSDVMPQVPSSGEETSNISSEPPASEESWDLTNFEFKVPSISNSPDSLGCEYSPLHYRNQGIPPFNLSNQSTNINTKLEVKSEGAKVKSEGAKVKVEMEEDERDDTKDDSARSGSESKSQISDSTDTMQSARKRKRIHRKRKSTAQSRRLRQENNKRAAARYRQRRKTYVNELEKKVDNLNEALDQKDSEVSRLQSKNSTLMKQLEYFKKLLGKNASAKALAALQMLVCVFAIVLGVAVSNNADSSTGMPMPHHRTLLSVPDVPEVFLCDKHSWTQNSGWGTEFLSCFDASAFVSILRFLVHVVVVPLVVYCNFVGFERSKGSQYYSFHPSSV
mmetsp:Transcript_3249/g.4427  ORF Transcript_3249/g.4427 Transcript_3249/m.4427 type:complete len:367 (+) Transcript_3249:105-1205(+)|eukprot:CAMPEP_0185252342 /NCGR_PEP_ID=MMETSP1359-20130426/1462_1 /TAXON_ID=552665 /ORGANISM="Bigelowiella longifila, Strain CCMP242" /LENGTH=366 /DNA_ID=CAMNT_0027834487 /DNA_START=104 /DNA_END=1204 /DNA_ORIENTATION=-